MITIEEGSIGGFGSHVKNLLAEKGIFDKGLKFRAMTLPDTFIEQDNPKKMYDVAGLNASQISKKILDILKTINSSEDLTLAQAERDFVLKLMGHAYLQLLYIADKI